MFFGSLAFVFEVMIYVGLGLPLVQLLLSAIGGGSEAAPDADADFSVDGGLDASADAELPDADLDLDVDAGELDLDGGGAAPAADGMPQAAGGGHGFALRFNLYCLCLSFVVMGAVGIFALESLTGAAQIGMLIVGAALALGAYVLLYRFVIWPLKKNDARALALNDLRFRHARVTFRITKDSPGMIETRDAVGAVISYRAEMDPDICKCERIEEGEEVIVCDIDREKNLCYVAPAERKILK